MQPRSSLIYCLVFAMFSSVALVGCRGCRSAPIVQRKAKTPDIDELEKKKKEKEKPKEDFDFQPPRVLPDDVGEVRALVKPGHWVTVRHIVKANNFDFQAELHTKSTDSNGKTLRIENTEFQMYSARPAPLPKGQEKAFDTTYYIPIVNTVDPLLAQPRSVWFARELRAQRGGGIVKEDVRQGTLPLPSYQYFVVVLSDEPERYAFLKPMTSFQAPTAGQAETTLTYYRVFTPTIDRVAPLPNHSLTWSAIAYFVWDDLAPVVLTSNQRDAMLEWLHWGGQIIISGPNSLEKLRGSFLEPYLPARGGNSIEVAQSAFDEINRHWSLTDRNNVQHKLDFIPDKPLTAIELTKHAAASYVPNTGQLLVERRVGIGRIVVTAFALTDSRFMKWKNYDNFFNGALLRRPRRNFRSIESLPDTIWADFDPVYATDARLTSTLRYFTRDTGHFSSQPESSSVQWEPGEEPLPDDPVTSTATLNPNLASMSNRPVRPSPPPGTAGPVLRDDWHFRGFPFRRNTGMAAWNDRSGPSDAAREALNDAAGISIPNGAFVLKVLATYLAILAPLNWLIFRSLGRVEWAWIAAPFIAIVGTFAVVRLAQLDIGFARSTTEIAIAEMHAGFPRAHITRYTALYTSLSTSYNLEYNDDGSLAQPFPTRVGARANQGPRTIVYPVTLRRDKKVNLSGFLVPSNTTRYLHSEHMQNLGGAFTLDRVGEGEIRLTNGTAASLESAGVLRRTLDGKFELAWIGELPTQATKSLRFEAAPNNRPHFLQWDETFITLSYNVQAKRLIQEFDSNGDGQISKKEAEGDPQMLARFDSIDQHRGGTWNAANRDRRWDEQELLEWCRESRAGETSLGQLMELASEAVGLVPGEMRLIGWTKQEVPGMTISPASAQDTRHTLFLVHLDPGVLPEPQSDLRMATDVMEEIVPENAAEILGEIGLGAPKP